MNEHLLETLRDAQRFGFFGSRAIEEAADHSLGFVEAIGPLDPEARLVDLGSGGGLPGLVLADRYPHVAITFVDRRQKRTDFLRRATTRLGFDHVEVLDLDVDLLSRRVDDGLVQEFDVVTARGFGPPALTLRLATRLIGPGGQIVISEPPTGDRWDLDLVEQLGLERIAAGVVSVFQMHPPTSGS